MAMFILHDKMLPLFGLVNSKVVFTILQTIAPTTNFELGHMEKIPVLNEIFDDEEVKEAVEKAISI